MKKREDAELLSWIQTVTIIALAATGIVILAIYYLGVYLEKIRGVGDVGSWSGYIF